MEARLWCDALGPVDANAAGAGTPTFCRSLGQAHVLYAYIAKPDTKAN